MALQWSEDLPADWDDVPEHPPEPTSDFVMEPHGNGVIMVPLRASVDDSPTQSYLFCERDHVASLGESTA